MKNKNSEQNKNKERKSEDAFYASFFYCLKMVSFKRRFIQAADTSSIFQAQYLVLNNKN